MAGRRPKPTELKRLTGNPGKRALNANEPKPPVIIPTCPPHLDATARSEWNRITPELFALQILSQIDRAALSAYCVAWSRWVDAEVNLRKFGPVIKTPSGYPVQNPYLGIANTAIDMMRKFLTEFGMTPASRSRISAAQKPEEATDPWDQLDAPTASTKNTGVQ